MPGQITYKYFYLVAVMLMFLKTNAQQDSASVGVMYREQGIASYYAHKFNGRRTTSGEIYRPKKFTAAHKTLPFGTKVKVTNIKTKKWVILTINDRGPRSKKRLIDVSYSAARHLGMLGGNGIVEVIVEQIPLIKSPEDDFRKREAQ